MRSQAPGLQGRFSEQDRVPRLLDRLSISAGNGGPGATCWSCAPSRPWPVDRDHLITRIRAGAARSVSMTCQLPQACGSGGDGPSKDGILEMVEARQHEKQEDSAQGASMRHGHALAAQLLLVGIFLAWSTRPRASTPSSSAAGRWYPPACPLANHPAPVCSAVVRRLGRRLGHRHLAHLKFAVAGAHRRRHRRGRHPASPLTFSSAVAHMANHHPPGPPTSSWGSCPSSCSSCSPPTAPSCGR